MKFRRMACDCCRSSEFPSLCKSPTYVMSEIVDGSNVIFLLMSKQGRATCGGPVVFDCAPLADAPRAADYGHDLPGPSDIISSRHRADEILAACWRPGFRLPGNDDFQEAESPVRRNRRLLAEDSGFWPRVSSRDADRAFREWD